jgi:prevent-host-death family protein
MRVVTIREAKANLSRLIEKVSQGEEITIVRRSKPVARLVPIAEIKRKRRPGSLKGKLHVGPEFFEAIPHDELARWE